MYVIVYTDTATSWRAMGPYYSYESALEICNGPVYLHECMILPLE